MKLCAVLAAPLLLRLRRRLDHRQYNGASLLGLQGVVVKSHGNADATALRRPFKRRWRRQNRMCRASSRRTAAIGGDASGRQDAKSTASAAAGDSAEAAEAATAAEADTEPAGEEDDTIPPRVAPAV